ncbi:alpha/beta hydrolase family protein [Priestia koreensis]|uniref:alpha/beta hydrolase family protein n=1 Tax=Priestia koreensis TaxID=284581 RepID=UPI0034573F7D
MKKFIIIVVSAIVCFSFTAFWHHANSEDQGEFKQRIPLPSPYNQHVDAYQLTYPSDGLKIKGFLLQPKHIDGKLPLLVYNRGGNREHGMIRQKTISYLASWAQKGYVVVATQYRGNGGSEGTETYGGKDIDDVINIMHIGEKLPYVDTTKKYAIGYSRGGMMTYLLMKSGAKFNAVAVVSGITDMFQFYDQRGPEMKQVLRQLVGDPKDPKVAQTYRDRSVIYWSDKINSPLLMLHGNRDWRVHYTQAEKLVRQLDQTDKEHKFILYKGADHPLTKYFNEYNAEIDKWFQAHS